MITGEKSICHATEVHKMVGDLLQNASYAILSFVRFPFFFFLAGGKIEWQEASMPRYRRRVAAAAFPGKAIHRTRKFIDAILNLGDGNIRIVDGIWIQSGADVHYLTRGDDKHVFKMQILQRKGYELASGPISLSVS